MTAYAVSNIEPVLGGFLIEKRSGSSRIFISHNLQFISLGSRNSMSLMFAPTDTIITTIKDKSINKVVYKAKKAKIIYSILPNLTIHTDQKQSLSRAERVIKTLLKSEIINHTLPEYSKIDVFLMRHDKIRLYLATVFTTDITNQPISKNQKIIAKIYISDDHPIPILEAILVHEFAHLIYEYHKLKNLYTTWFLPLEYRLDLIFKETPNPGQRRERLEHIKEGFYFNKSFPTLGHPYTDNKELFASSLTILYLLVNEKHSMLSLEDENAKNIEQHVKTMVENDIGVWQLLYYIASSVFSSEHIPKCLVTPSTNSFKDDRDFK